MRERVSESRRSSVSAESVCGGTLTEAAMAKADQIGRRLQAELREVMDLLPAGHRAASAMARLLQLDRATCQRLVQGASGHNPGPRTLIVLPGVGGLRQFLAAVAERVPGAASAESVAGASAAVDRFQAFLDEVNLSQRGLRAVLEGSAGRVPRFAAPPDDALARESLFVSAAEVVGRWSEASIHLSVIRPVPGDDTVTDWARARVLAGHRWRPSAVPLEVGGTATLRGPGPGPSMGALEPAQGSGLLEAFCTRPIPPVVAKAAGKRMVHVIDTDAVAGQGPADIVTATRVARPDPHPATLSPPVGEVWALQNIPARRLVFDTLVHRTMAAACVAGLEAHLWMPDVGSRHDAARWSTRLPGGPALTPLSVRDLSTGAFAAYPDLVAHVFDELAWPIDEFVGFRCDVAYPVWRGGYVMRFDFAPSDGA